MLSPATRLSNMKGPTQIGFEAKLALSLASCVGDMMMAALEARRRRNGVYGALRWKTTVEGPEAVTLSTGSKSLARREPGSVFARSIVVTTACALNGVPSLNWIPFRS